MTVTPVGKWPSTWRYLAESNDDASLAMSVTAVAPGRSAAVAAETGDRRD